MNSSPIDTGNADWNTIAPVMLPIASVSLRRRTQITLLNFSGSSVASGATNKENASGGIPAAAPMLLTAPTKISAPKMISPSATATCTNGAATGPSFVHTGSERITLRSQLQK